MRRKASFPQEAVASSVDTPLGTYPVLRLGDTYYYAEGWTFDHQMIGYRVNTNIPLYSYYHRPVHRFQLASNFIPRAVMHWISNH